MPLAAAGTTLILDSWSDQPDSEPLEYFEPYELPGEPESRVAEDVVHHHLHH